MAEKLQVAEEEKRRRADARLRADARMQVAGEGPGKLEKSILRVGEPDLAIV